MLPNSNNIVFYRSKWVRQEVFCRDWGYTEKAIERKRQDGIWLEGKHWKKAPDRHIVICPAEIDKWIDNYAA